MEPVTRFMKHRGSGAISQSAAPVPRQSQSALQRAWCRLRLSAAPNGGIKTWYRSQRNQQALKTLAKYRGRFEAAGTNRDELYDRKVLR